MVKDERRTRRSGARSAVTRKTDNWISTGSSVFRRECALWAGGLDDRLGPFADCMLGRKLALRFGFFRAEAGSDLGDFFRQPFPPLGLQGLSPF
jgi:hypothetical protein